MAKSGASKGAKGIKIFNDGVLDGVNVANYSIEDKKNVRRENLLTQRVRINQE